MLDGIEVGVGDVEVVFCIQCQVIGIGYVVVQVGEYVDFVDYVVVMQWDVLDLLCLCDCYQQVIQGWVVDDVVGVGDGVDEVGQLVIR